MSQHGERPDETSAASSIFTFIASVAFVFFCGPHFYHASIGAVQSFAAQNYGIQGELIAYFWVVIIGLGGYGAAKLIIFLVLKLGMFALAQGRGY